MKEKSVKKGKKMEKQIVDKVAKKGNKLRIFYVEKLRTPKHCNKITWKKFRAP